MNFFFQNCWRGPPPHVPFYWKEMLTVKCISAYFFLINALELQIGSDLALEFYNSVILYILLFQNTVYYLYLLVTLFIIFFYIFILPKEWSILMFLLKICYPGGDPAYKWNWNSLHELKSFIFAISKIWNLRISRKVLTHLKAPWYHHDTIG